MYVDQEHMHSFHVLCFMHDMYVGQEYMYLYCDILSPGDNESPFFKGQSETLLVHDCITYGELRL